MRQILGRRLQELRWGSLAGINWLTTLLDQLVLEAGLRLDPNLLLFRKSLLTLDGVVGDLTGMKKQAANALLDEAVMADFIEHWIFEWPRRFFAPFEERSFRTHISAADLVRLIWSAPLTLGRRLGKPKE